MGMADINDWGKGVLKLTPSSVTFSNIVEKQPKTREITNINQLRIGQYATWCCHLDLQAIDEELLVQIKEDWTDPDPWPIYHVWETKEEALFDIQRGFPKNSDEYKEIDKMLYGI